MEGGVAREAMLAVGCIQSQLCHTGHCPAGVATQSKWLQRGLNVQEKGKRMEKYITSFRKELLMLAHASGHKHPAQFTGADVDICTGVNEFTSLESIFGYKKAAVTLDGLRQTL